MRATHVPGTERRVLRLTFPLSELDALDAKCPHKRCLAFKEASRWSFQLLGRQDKSTLALKCGWRGVDYSTFRSILVSARSKRNCSRCNVS